VGSSIPEIVISMEWSDSNSTFTQKAICARADILPSISKGCFHLLSIVKGRYDSIIIRFFLE